LRLGGAPPYFALEDALPSVTLSNSTNFATLAALKEVYADAVPDENLLLLFNNVQQQTLYMCNVYVIFITVCLPWATVRA